MMCAVAQVLCFLYLQQAHAGVSNALDLLSMSGSLLWGSYLHVNIAGSAQQVSRVQALQRYSMWQLLSVSGGCCG